MRMTETRAHAAEAQLMRVWWRRERQRVWMTEGEARMEELSAQFREVKTAHDELVDRKATMQVH